MSAPLVVNTVDGTVWTRRAVTRGGIALYAPQDVCQCPEFVMATEAELAEHGIVGSADVLPVPVGPEPKSHTMLDHARSALTARMSKDDLRLVLENTVNFAASLQARVAELEAERHSTNEALHDAVQALRANTPTEPTEVDAYLRTALAEDVYLKFQQAIGEQALAEAVEDAGTVRASADNDGLYNADWREGWDDAIERIDPDHNGPCPTALVVFPGPSAPSPEESADKLTTQALREDETQTCAFKNAHEPHTNDPGRPSQWQCPGVPRSPQTGGAR